MRPRQPSFRDRTREFRDAVDSAPCCRSPVVCGATVGSLHGASEFRRRAAGVGAGISEASRKIARLAQLAKSTSVFYDPTMDIQNLTVLINKEITALNASVLDLQILFNSQNEGVNISGDTANHSTAIVDSLKKGLINTAEEFKEVLTTRTKSLKAHQNRRKILSSSASGDGSNPSVRQGQSSEFSIPPAPWAIDSVSNPSFQRQRNSGDVPRPFMQQQQLAVQQDNYIQSRVEAIQNVESTIHELSNIFTLLATMVSQQGELAVRIHDDMDDTLANVEGAQGQLLKYLNNISSNRWLMTKIFIVLMVFLIIFILFVA